jgi:hypothetical protein
MYRFCTKKSTFFISYSKRNYNSLYNTILDQQQVKIRGVEGGEDEFSVFFNLFKMTWGLFSVEVRSSLVLVKAFEAVRSLQLGSQPVPTNLI